MFPSAQCFASKTGRAAGTPRAIVRVGLQLSFLEADAMMRIPSPGGARPETEVAVRARRVGRALAAAAAIGCLMLSVLSQSVAHARSLESKW